MAERDRAVEYVDLPRPGGGPPLKTLSIRLYRPDGRTFIMPHGADPLLYVNKGFKTKPDAIWRAKNKEFEETKAASLRLSEFQGKAKNRQKAIEAKAILNAQVAEMERQEAEFEAAEAALANPPDPDPEPVVPAVVSETPKPKPDDGLDALTKSQLSAHVKMNGLNIVGFGPMNKTDSIAAIRATHNED